MHANSIAILVDKDAWRETSFEKQMEPKGGYDVDGKTAFGACSGRVSSISPVRSSKDGEDASSTATPGGADPTRFPARLHRMLMDIETNGQGMEQIVSWQPHGKCKSSVKLLRSPGVLNLIACLKLINHTLRCVVFIAGFIIRNKQAFTENVMPT
jgi:hypothetical protein